MHAQIANKGRLDKNFWRGRRVLITGHTGFKGSWLTSLLLQLGAQVWGYALPPEAQPALFTALGFERGKASMLDGTLHHRLGDINDQEAFANHAQEVHPDVVFHLAAQPLVRQSYIDPLGTWNTNVLGSLRVLAALQSLSHSCAVVMVTTDKVYENREWLYGYRETDALGGCDPYSASKAAMELAVASWRSSFCGDAPHQNPHLAIATARAGNVIGGGDWAVDRIVPDAMRALASEQPISVRNPLATRPWQHVIEPLSGYLLLAQNLYHCQSSEQAQPNPYTRAFNFGPSTESNRSVQDLVETLLCHWSGQWSALPYEQAPHEAGLLHLVSDLARQQLGWQPRWNFATTVERTVGWYRQIHNGAGALECCLDDWQAYALGGLHD